LGILQGGRNEMVTAIAGFTVYIYIRAVTWKTKAPNVTHTKITQFMVCGMDYTA